MKTKGLDGVFEALSSEELMRDSQPCNLFSEVLEELRKESEGRIFDAYALEKGQTWSQVAIMSVGYSLN